MRLIGNKIDSRPLNPKPFGGGENPARGVNRSLKPSDKGPPSSQSASTQGTDPELTVEAKTNAKKKEEKKTQEEENQKKMQERRDQNSAKRKERKEKEKEELSAKKAEDEQKKLKDDAQKSIDDLRGQTAKKEAKLDYLPEKERKLVKQEVLAEKKIANLAQKELDENEDDAELQKVYAGGFLSEYADEVSRGVIRNPDNQDLTPMQKNAKIHSKVTPQSFKQEIAGRKTLTLKFRMLENDEPLADADYVIRGAGKQIKDKSDSDGVITIEVPKSTKKFRIRIANKTHSVKILDSFSEKDKGIQERLRNAGFYFGKIDGILGKESKKAEKYFRDKQEMPEEESLLDGLIQFIGE